MTPDEMKAIQEQNIARAKSFAELFTGIKVTSCGFGQTGAMAVHHNRDTAWGFTVEFMTLPGGANIIRAWTEHIGKDGDQEAIAAELKKIVGG